MNNTEVSTKMIDVRFNIFSFKRSVKWKQSIILYLCEILAFFLQIISVIAWVGQISSWLGREKPFPLFVTELWLLSILLTQVMILVWWQNFSESLQNFHFWLAIYFLSDSTAATLRDVILAPNIHSGSIQVYNRQRWLILSLLSIFEVILSFAILILCYGNQFVHPVCDSLTAIYVSTVTFLTLGYGDFYPIGIESKIIVLSELVFFLVFLALKLPLAVGMLKIVDYQKQADNDR